MWRCKSGYGIGDDGRPPSRCRNIDKYSYRTCKEDCPDYNHEYDLVNKAIESAKCRIYRLKQNEGSTLTHQKKAKNQQELMKITIKALKYYRDEAEF